MGFHNQIVRRTGALVLIVLACSLLFVFRRNDFMSNKENKHFKFLSPDFIAGFEIVPVFESEQEQQTTLFEQNRNTTIHNPGMPFHSS